MTAHNNQTSNNSSRPFTAMVDGLPIWLFTLVICMQMVQQAFAAPAADHTVVHVASSRNMTITVGNAAQNAVVQQSAASVEGSAKVSIVNFEFSPAEITIVSGESVTWTNDDGAPHGLAYRDGAKGTDLLLPGATFNRRFNQPGTYDYNCSVHPYMTGRVVVRAK